LKKNENEIITLKKELEDVKDMIDDSYSDKTHISNKVIQLVDNLKNIQTNNLEVFSILILVK
jgi:hypothetical protein